MPAWITSGPSSSISAGGFSLGRTIAAWPEISFGPAIVYNGGWK
jgi:hypothetical protein